MNLREEVINLSEAFGLDEYQSGKFRGKWKNYDEYKKNKKESYYDEKKIVLKDSSSYKIYKNGKKYFFLYAKHPMDNQSFRQFNYTEDIDPKETSRYGVTKDGFAGGNISKNYLSKMEDVTNNKDILDKFIKKLKIKKAMTPAKSLNDLQTK